MSKIQGIVAKVKSSYSIIEYIESKGIVLKPQGSGFIGVCPFHDDNHPSMNVSEVFRNYKCFACGAEGDIISFAREYDNLDFITALETLGSAKGIDVAREMGGEYDKEKHQSNKKLKEIITKVTEFYVDEFNKLPDSHPAVEEIVARGLSRNGFEYGYAPNGNRVASMLREAGFNRDDCVKAGVLSVSDSGKVYDRWRNRLMFIIRDTAGNPVGFSGRKLDKDSKGGKYVNSPDSPVFDKSSLLYNLSEARKKVKDNNDTIYIVEGQFDVIAMVESGVKSTVASSGTAFTNRQASMCRRTVGEKGSIVFCFDGDEAGVKATLKVFENTVGVHDRTFVVALENGLDPCDYMMRKGSAELKNLVESCRTPIVEYVLDRVLEGFDLSSVLERNKALNAVLEVLSIVSNDVLLDYYSKVASDRVGVSHSVLKEKLSEVSKTGGENRTLESSVFESELVERVYAKNSVSEREVEYLNRLEEGDVKADCSARLVRIVFEKPEIVKNLVKAGRMYVDTVPMTIIKEYYTKKGGAFVAEDSSYYHTVLTVSENNFFPMLHLMSDQEIIKMTEFLISELKGVYVDEELFKISGARKTSLSDLELAEILSEEKKILSL